MFFLAMKWPQTRALFLFSGLALALLDVETRSGFRVRRKRYPYDGNDLAGGPAGYCYLRVVFLPCLAPTSRWRLGTRDWLLVSGRWEDWRLGQIEVSCAVITSPDHGRRHGAASVADGNCGSSDSGDLAAVW